MKLGVDVRKRSAWIMISDVQDGICLKTENGHKIDVTMNDNKISINVIPYGNKDSYWYVIDGKTGQIEDDY